MMRNKKIVSVLLTLILVFYMAIPLLATELTSTTEHGYNVDVRWQNEVNSLALRDELYSDFGQNRAGDVIFPGYYGGSFLDENGNMVINMVMHSDTREAADSLSPLISRNGLEVRAVEFSYADLRAVMAYICNRISYLLYTDPGHPLFDILVYETIDVIGNRMAIGLLSITEECIDIFRQYVIDSPKVIFRETGPIALAYLIIDDYDNSIADINATIDDYGLIDPTSSFIQFVTVRPGDRINIEINDPIHGRVFRGFSVGYGVTVHNTYGSHVGRNGFVTAPHGQAALSLAWSPSLTVQSSGGSNMGSILQGYQHFSGHVDAAIVLPGLSHSPFGFSTPHFAVVNEVGGRPLTRAYLLNLMVGQTLNSIGATTGGIRSGQVTNNNFTVTHNGVTFTHLVQTNMGGKGGDSGGLVYNNNMDVAGIIMGADEVPIAGVHPNMFFSRGMNIRNVLDYTR